MLNPLFVQLKRIKNMAHTKKHILTSSIFFLSLALLWLPRGYPGGNWAQKLNIHKKKPNFSLACIAPTQPCDKYWLSPPLIGCEDVFSQKFTYLDAGVQSYAFLSADKKYVLKFLKQRRSEKFPKKRFLTFSSYKIAYEYLRDQTGLLFMHLVPGDGFKQTLTLVDHEQKEHTIELGDFEFFLQKRADLIMPILTNKMKNSEEKEAKEIIDALFSFFHTRLDKGILDHDPNIPINFALCEGKIIQIDIGRFSWAEKATMYKTDWLQFVKKNALFMRWLKKSYPELHVYFMQHCAILKERYKKISKPLPQLVSSPHHENESSNS